MKNPQIEMNKTLAQSLEDRRIEVAMYDLNAQNYEMSLTNIAAEYPNGFDDSEAAQHDAMLKVRLEGLLRDTKRERNIAYRTLQVIEQQVIDREIDVDAMLALVAADNAVDS